MWEISEGDTKFLYAMKLMPLEDLGFQSLKLSKSQKLLMQTLYSF